MAMAETGQFGVVYLLTDIQLAARLVVSIFSLRRWYDGPIVVFTTRPESHEIGEYCAEDPELRVTHMRCRERAGWGNQSAYLTKTKISRRGPFVHNLFLDADTLVAGSIDELFQANTMAPLVATGFMAGASNQDPVRARLRVWQSIQDEVHPSYELKRRLSSLIKHPHPAVNAGVFAFRRDADCLARWDKLTRAGQRMPLPDEIAMQIILLEAPHLFLGHHFNCHPSGFSHRFGVKIWHFAGRSHLIPGCNQLWLPVYRECIDKGIARIGQWSRVESMQHEDGQEWERRGVDFAHH
jgi:hypothetical protein